MANFLGIVVFITAIAGAFAITDMKPAKSSDYDYLPVMPNS